MPSFGERSCLDNNEEMTQRIELRRESMQRRRKYRAHASASRSKSESAGCCFQSGSEAFNDDKLENRHGGAKNSATLGNEMNLDHFPDGFYEKYDVFDQLGIGRFGKVHRVKEKSTGISWAAKFVDVTLNDSHLLLPNEISIMKRLNHENLLKLHEVFKIGSIVILVQELMLGGALDLFIYESFDDENPVPETQLKDYVRQVLRGVQYMHEHHICHNDIWAGNILLATPRGIGVKLMDFGVAEQIEDNAQSSDFADEMRSIGDITHYLLTGRDNAPYISGEAVTGSARKELDFSDYRWGSQWKTAKDLIDRLTDSDKTKRPTAKEALDHIWLLNRSSNKDGESLRNTS